MNLNEGDKIASLAKVAREEVSQVIEEGSQSEPPPIADAPPAEGA